ncbi:MAG: homocysteine S-methyltransferase family protein [Gammaproteobacteria bacterium]|nr:homocysteine S-methyltransferase family protein [Gammaproteobacteria bacterium]
MTIILDGGMGSELIRRGVGDARGLWSARALLEAPEAVVEVHRDYMAAGAEIIITNTYSTIPSYLGKLGMERRWLELTELAGKLARSAVDGSASKALVAGSLPPLSESYRADLVPPDADAQPLYRQMVEALDPYVDLFICETMSSAREARNAASMARRHSTKPVHVSWTLAEAAGAGLRSGETLAAALDGVADLVPDALLFNCTSPQAIASGLAQLAELTDKPLGAYPNRFSVPDGWTLDGDAQTVRRELSVEAFVNHALQWRELGASLIGGCCGIGPEYISAAADRLRSA